MATNYAAGRGMTLNDLLQSAYGDQAAPTAAPQAPRASEIVTPGTLTASEQQKLIDVLFQPEDVGPAPPPEKPEAQRAIGMGLSALGDAVNAFAAYKGGQPGLRSFYGSEMQNQFERQRADLQRYYERKSQADRQAKKGKAAYILGKGEQAEEVGRKRQELIEDRAAQALTIKANRDWQLEQTALEKDYNLKRDAANKQWDIELQKANFAHQEGLASLERKQREGDKVAGKQQEAFGKAVAYVVGLGDQVEAMLAGDQANGIAPQTPEQIQNRVRHAFDVMTGIGLTGDARKSAEAYFVQEIGPILRDYKVKQEDAAEAERRGQTPTAGQMIGQDVLQRSIEALRTSKPLKKVSEYLGPGR